MIPLHVILIGCSKAARPQLRRTLGNLLVVVEAEYSDVQTVLADVPSNSEEPRLFILHLHGPEDLPALKRLSSAYPRQPILGLRDPSDDPTLFREAMRQGASFVLSLPLTGEDFTTVLNWLGREFGLASRQSHLIAVSGVTGGAGATTLALNLAAAIAHQRKVSTLLVELSFKMGMLATLLNLEPQLTVLDLLREIDELDIDLVQRVSLPVGEHLHVITGPPELQQHSSPTWAEVSPLLPYFKTLAEVVVLDVPCTYDDFQFDALTAMDQVVLVAQQKIPSIRALQMVRQSLMRRGGLGKQHIVIDRYDERQGGFSRPDLEKHLGMERLRTVAYDVAVTAAGDHGHLLRQEAPRSPALVDIDQLVQVLLPQQGGAPPAAAAERSSFFGKLVRSFGLT